MQISVPSLVIDFSTKTPFLIINLFELNKFGHFSFFFFFFLLFWYDLFCRHYVVDVFHHKGAQVKTCTITIVEGIQLANNGQMHI